MGNDVYTTCYSRDKGFKNGLSKICGRQSSKIWSDMMNCLTLSYMFVKNDQTYAWKDWTNHMGQGIQEQTK